MATEIRKVKTAVVGCGMISNIYIRNLKHLFSVIDLTGSPDLESIAAAYGMKFLHLDDEAKMADTIREFLANDESVLL